MASESYIGFSMRQFFSLFLLGLITLSQPAYALFENKSQGFGKEESAFVTVDQAFPLIAYQEDDRFFVSWDIMPGYYLYQQRLSVSAQGAEIGTPDMVNGTPYQDEFFGAVNIYTEPLNIQVPILSVQSNAKLIVQYQGCAKAGFCYPPETRTFPIEAVTAATSVQKEKEEEKTDSDQKTENQPITNIQSEQENLAVKLDNTWWTPLLFLALGIGLAFTPCVFPMYPILTGIVLGGGKLSHSKAFGLSFIYVQGMALTYTLLGLVVASAGLQFQAALQHPYVLSVLSLLFVLLALSMFGVYTIQLPTGIQTWLNNLSNKQQGGNSLGVFLMGAISGLVCSPCTTAPLSGALIYVAQSGDLLTGGIALYALGLGMGIPLIIVAIFGNQLLPKAGGWMEKVKVLFGFILLAAPVFLLERILSPDTAVILWSLLGLAAFGWLYHIKNSLAFGSWKQSLVGIIAMLGLVGSVIPLYKLWFTPAENVQTRPMLTFTRIQTVSDLEQQLRLAREAGKPVMLDFYADWCVACKEFEMYTFHTPEVEAKLKDYVLLQADVTNNTPADIALFKKLKIIGLPTIDFWDPKGNYHSSARITGFMQSPEFTRHLESLAPSEK